jgi:hypothetical protein
MDRGHRRWGDATLALAVPALPVLARAVRRLVVRGAVRAFALVAAADALAGSMVVASASVGVTSAAAQDAPAARCPMDVPRPDSPERRGAGAPPPAWDLRCIELIPAAAGGDARGVVTLESPRHRSA